jgi:hypothetical protein
MMPPVTDTIGVDDNFGFTGSTLSTTDVLADNATIANSLAQHPARMTKANQNTVVVVAESVTQRPAAAEARRRRKEILMKQSKQHQALTDSTTYSKSTVATQGSVSGALVVDDNALVEAATLAAVAAAAAAAVDASVDLVSTEAIKNAVNATTPTDDVLTQNGSVNVIDGSNSTSSAGTMDIPFLDDAVIAATAAAVAMNNVTASTTATPMIHNEDPSNAATKKKVRKRDRTTGKNNNIDARNSGTDPGDDHNEDDENDDCDENGNPSNSKKTQIRYDPSIPMEKEQLAAWRREARRVRNRESAAASRQRIRGRITELEDELYIMKHKYEAAIMELQHLKNKMDQE